jgi:hypothetical protein
MNTNTLKKFAQEANKKLVAQIGAKMDYVLNTDSVELREKETQVRRLKEEISKTSKSQVIDKVAYTWFNRLMALRFMDVNDFQPLGVRVISPKDGFTTPELLEEVKQGHIPADLLVKKDKIFDLLDGKIPSPNPQNEVFKELLIGSCNHLHKTLPFLFERINDYTDLLLPDDLISDFSIVHDIRTGMSAEDCKEVEIIGWLYQFYISEKKDQVFASGEKVKKEDIPAATQLFTPRWIVEYMVQNTVGKLWLQNRPNSKLKEHMPYYIESASVQGSDYLKINSVEEIKLLDQACGSGHILVYGFDLFYKIYEEEGYNPNEIPQLILEKNLFGFEIDERAAQLASMALMMKARSYNRRLFRDTVTPHILCYEDLRLSKAEIDDTFRQIGVKASDGLLHDFKTMGQATNLGSLIYPHSTLEELQTVGAKLQEKAISTDAFLSFQIQQLQTAVYQLIHLGEKYHCVVDNPPYMGGGKMNNELSNWVKINFSDAKADLLSCFIERAVKQVPENGYLGFVTMESWMFLSSFEEFRKKLIDNIKIHSLSHFGWHIMRIAFGTVSFILENSKPENDFTGTYSFMEYDNIDQETERPIIFPINSNGRFKQANQKDFEKIPGSPIGYWLNDNALGVFDNQKVGEISSPRLGMATADNLKFLRFTWEVSIHNCKINAISRVEAKESLKRWFPYAKGGEYRKWFGNLEYLVDWKGDGFSIMNFKDEKGKVRSHNYNLDFIFKQGITWNALSSNFTSFRVLQNSLFDNAGSSLFLNRGELRLKMLAYLNSKVVKFFLPVINPTLNFQPGTISALPFLDSEKINEKIISDSIDISELDWSSKEIFFDFQKNEILRRKTQSLEDSFDLNKQYWSTKFFQIHRNEEELNRQFIEIYGLQDELTPDVPFEEITILQDELDRETLRALNTRLERNPETGLVTDYSDIELKFDSKEVFAQFISYAVGCMFGRYSLDKEGLILANQGETLEDYLRVIAAEGIQSPTFFPDVDNIIPVLDDEWFEDDIVSRFKEFLRVTFGKENLEKNLAFVESSIGKDIRKYFVKDFYTDHIQRYKKRPIYWMFSSPNGSFNVLIYMHRYTPDTLSKILNDYLNQYREKLRARVEHLDQVMISGSSTEQTKADKEKGKIRTVLLELQEYERDILYPLATERIAIDLDEGVLVNYNKFGKAIKDVAGLNDDKAKVKVREFDWIDVSTIR